MKRINRIFKRKIVMVASEVEPFAKTGGLGDVLGALPKALSENNCNVIVVMPKYQQINEKYCQQMEFLGYIYVDLNWRHQYCGIFKLIKDNVTYYFLDNEFYFKHEKLYNDLDLEKFSFLDVALFEVLKYIDFKPDIIHAHDWQTGVVPALLKLRYQKDNFFKKTKCVYTIHNLQYQGKFDKNQVLDILPLASDDYRGEVNFMKMGIIYSDKITTVSPTYMEEIKTPQYGEGLNQMLSDYYYKLEGILNGIDYNVYNPAIDKFIDVNYDDKNYVNYKKINKLNLLTDLNLNKNIDIPLIGIITRLASQKGIDLIIQIMDELLSKDVNVILLGSGEQYYENIFRYFQNQYPNKFVAVLKFDNALAHKIYAASDLFLMPSLFEPCGLAQMICLKYATLPIVHETGGLKDSIKSYNEFEQTGNGFSFSVYSRNDFMFTINRALNFYYRPEEFNKIIKNALDCDFSWTNSSKKYILLYDGLIEVKE